MTTYGSWQVDEGSARQLERANVFYRPPSGAPADIEVDVRASDDPTFATYDVVATRTITGAGPTAVVPDPAPSTVARRYWRLVLTDTGDLLDVDDFRLEFVPPAPGDPIAMEAGAADVFFGPAPSGGGGGGGTIVAAAVSIADAGDYFTGTNVETALQELGAGGVGGGSLPDDFHGVRAFRTGSQTIANNTATAVQFNHHDFDTDGYHDDVTDNDKVVVPAGQGGLPFDIEAAVAFDENATGQRLTYVLLNGTDILVPVSEPNPGASFVPHLVLSTTRILQEGDELQLIVYQNSGGDLDVINGSEPGDYVPSFGIHVAGAVGVELLADDIPLSDATPLVESGSGAAGTAEEASRADHVHPSAAGGSTTELLGITSYRPGSDSAVTTTTSSTSADVDATNAAVTFTAPASGNVLVRATFVEGNSGANLDYAEVRESTTVLADTIVSNGAAAGIRSAAFRVTGISAGSHTYKLGVRTAGGTLTVYGGPTWGPVVLEVWSA